MSNMKDFRGMALIVAKEMLKGTAVAFYDKAEDKVEVVPTWLVQKDPRIVLGMEGATIEKVAEYCQWDADVIEVAKEQLAKSKKKKVYA